MMTTFYFLDYFYNTISANLFCPYPIGINITFLYLFLARY